MIYCSYHSLLGVTQISCWESSTEGIIQKKCSNYHLDSQYTDLGSKMQMALKVLLVVHIKCSQRLNPGITWTQQHFYLISISCSKQVTKSTQMHLYYMWKSIRIVSIISWSVKRMKMKWIVWARMWNLHKATCWSETLRFLKK